MAQNLTDDGPIDFAYIQKMMDDNPDDWYVGEEADQRFEGAVRHALATPPVSDEDIIKRFGRP